jgi:tRNA threonylcarbamoyladenosine biosynthesis protein TsaB
MKVLAIDTATERCSVALRIDGQVLVRSMDTARGHADNVLPLLDELLREAGVTLPELDGIAYGRGPGAFTGVRIAVGVVQGLALGARLLTVGISNLAAVAQQVAKPAQRVLVCMDARMGEVYWAVFECDPRSGLVVAAGTERVGRPETVNLESGILNTLAGTGFGAHPQLAAAFGQLPVHGNLLPRAQDIALLGEAELVAGRGKPAAEAQPVYLRDQVAIAKRPS